MDGLSLTAVAKLRAPEEKRGRSERLVVEVETCTSGIARRMWTTRILGWVLHCRSGEYIVGSLAANPDDHYSL